VGVGQPVTQSGVCGVLSHSHSLPCACTSMHAGVVLLAHG
jgi:hypothetical protein